MAITFEALLTEGIGVRQARGAIERLRSEAELALQ